MNEIKGEKNNDIVHKIANEIFMEISSIIRKGELNNKIEIVLNEAFSKYLSKVLREGENK